MDFDSIHPRTLDWNPEAVGELTTNDGLCGRLAYLAWEIERMRPESQWIGWANYLMKEIEKVAA